MGLETENTRKDKHCSLHVQHITIEAALYGGLTKRFRQKLEFSSNSLVSKVCINTRGIILLEYGISLTQWLIILTLYDDGFRLTKSMLSHLTQLLTHHPLNAALQPSHNEEMCPLVYCITNQYVHPCRA